MCAVHGSCAVVAAPKQLARKQQREITFGTIAQNQYAPSITGSHPQMDEDAAELD